MYKDKEKLKEWARLYYHKNKEKLKEKRKLYYKNNISKIKQRKSLSIGEVRNRHYVYKYSITLEKYNELLNQQNGVCAICKKSESTLDKQGNLANLCVDHDHISGKIRGLLCRMCNSALGKFKDDINLLNSAIQYLKNE